ncbi:hypothetical protein O6H91_16G022800 [Diphasiastrum complanatum]|uniref:Uncharacterized protein n=1 Tax=Diphasiastrum complanatum TaxID=34168 RepID=A0ACC2BAH9_DIPCM|nr:hypothetical protein O6H91_16G022800 [Diphasiastrum complanatum]
MERIRPPSWRLSRKATPDRRERRGEKRRGEWIAFWHASIGIKMSDTDEREALERSIHRYLGIEIDAAIACRTSPSLEQLAEDENSKESKRAERRAALRRGWLEAGSPRDIRSEAFPLDLLPIKVAHELKAWRHRFEEVKACFRHSSISYREFKNRCAFSCPRAGDATETTCSRDLAGPSQDPPAPPQLSAHNFNQEFRPVQLATPIPHQLTSITESCSVSNSTRQNSRTKLLILQKDSIACITGDRYPFMTLTDECTGKGSVHNFHFYPHIVADELPSPDLNYPAVFFEAKLMQGEVSSQHIGNKQQTTYNFKICYQICVECAEAKISTQAGPLATTTGRTVSVNKPEVQEYYRSKVPEYYGSDVADCYEHHIYPEIGLHHDVLERIQSQKYKQLSPPVQVDRKFDETWQEN